MCHTNNNNIIIIIIIINKRYYISIQIEKILINLKTQGFAQTCIDFAVNHVSSKWKFPSYSVRLLL